MIEYLLYNGLDNKLKTKTAGKQPEAQLSQN